MRESEQAIYDQIERQLGRPVTAVMTIDEAATAVMARHRIVRFRNSIMIKTRKPYGQFVPMDKATFDQIAYPLVMGMPTRRINDTFHYLRSTAKDLTANDHFILFGAGTNHQIVWDMEALEVRTDISPDDCVWRSLYAPMHITKPVKFIMDLADGNVELYSDIMQSLAPLIMTKKPDGVIWWAGDGTDSKLAITRALNEIFPGQLSNISVKQLNGGRSNTSLLNGVLGNIAEDSGQVTNAEIYKSIGAHEDFNMHKYHSQKGIEIRGNVHHVFLVDSAPRFYARSLSISRRTHVVPFGHNDKNLAYRLPDNQLGQLVAEMCRYAAAIKHQGYRYEWSGVTHAPKLIAA